MMSPLETHRTTSTRGDLALEEITRHSRTSWQDLTLPARRELTTALKRCDRKGTEDIALLIEAIQAKEVRDPTLSLLCRKDYLIRRPSVRGRFLEALTPYAHELPVQAYAMMSLRDPLYKRSLAVCAPAARLLDADKAQRDPTITYELIDLAGRLAPSSKDGAAKIAFILLKDCSLSSAQRRAILFNSRVWYAEYAGEKNPWLPIITRQKDSTTIRLLRTMLDGDMSDPRDHPILANLLTLPLLPHEVALTASIVTIAAQRIGRLFGQNNNIAATTAAMAATTIIVGARYLYRAKKLDTLNRSRDPERIEAAAFLGALLHEIRAQDPKLDKRLDAMIHRALSDNSVSFLQSPLVRSAARLALSGVTESEKLRSLASLSIQDFDKGDS
jgi:hypothetical protein